MSENAAVPNVSRAYFPVGRPRAYLFRSLRAEDDRPVRPQQPMILIHGVERRIRALGHVPVRSFDARRGWTLAIDEQVIAVGGSLGELARDAAAWLADRESGEGV